ncbi:MAG: barA [Gammaproteobacteria bacterium]|jgi:two-component system sensor histidine kinase BarA|nr:barA [Gammaproteobacteria bacterium]
MTLPNAVIDWELAIKCGSNSRAFAEEMFALLARDLPNELLEIKKEYANNKIQEFKHRIHKLHGALCYCGAPRLKAATIALETAIRSRNYSQIPELLEQFEYEANELIQQLTHLRR